MKRLQLFTVLMLFSTFISFGQVNRSDSLVVSNFNGASPSQQFGGQEIFRFQPGVVTQLNNGFDFGFSNSRWFSLGELNTGTQTVFGLRFQLPNRSVALGYQDITDSEPNPRIQWFDDTNDPTNLEFRFTDDFMSTNSNLIASITSEGKFILPGQILTIGPVFPPIQTSNRFELINDTFNNEIYTKTKFSSNTTGIGVWGDSRNNKNNVGVRGEVGNNVNSDLTFDPEFAYTIEGIASPNTSFSQFNTSFAGFFNGAVNVTGTLTHGSDRKLKEDLSESENVLEKISQVKAYTYEFKDNPDLNLPLGLQHGLIAQDVEKVYPELVKKIVYPIYNDKQELQGTDTYKSVNYIGLISELTAAVNQLNQKVEDLKASKTTLVYSSQFTEEELAKIKANGYQLEQNIPNPFSGATSIQYSLPKNGPHVSIMIFDLSGKLVNSYKLKERKRSTSCQSISMKNDLRHKLSAYVGQ